jgi:anaerobic selenocysteine-containing dehydrogenase
MVSRSVALRELQKRPFVEMNDEDVKELGLADGDRVRVAGDGFETVLEVRVGDIVKGSVFVPFDQRGLRANELIRSVNPRVTVVPE